MKSLATAGAFAALMATAAPAFAGNLVVCIEGSPESFNPQLTSNATTSIVTGQIYDQLISVKAGGSDLEPSLAESWTVSEDGRTYTFKLRRDVSWHSNKTFKPSRPFNADDVVFSFERMMKADHPYHKVSGGNYITFNTKLADALASVRKIDDYTVAFTLKDPLAPFTGILSHQSLAILSAEYADQLLKAGTPEQLDRQPIGTGPFQFTVYQTNAIVRLKAFHETWGERAKMEARTPKVEDLIMPISTDAAVRLQRAQAGECHIANAPSPTDREAIKASQRLNLVETPVASSGFVAFNFKDKPFQDKRVRQALADAINMKSLVDIVFDGTGGVTGALIPASLWGHNPDLKGHPYNVERAKALLTEAGFPNGFETQLWALPVTRPYMPNGRRAAELIQSDWAKIGVKAEIVSFEWGEYVKRARLGEAKMAMFGGIWDFPDPSQIPNNYFTCNADGKPSPSNIGAWCNATFNDLILRAGQITDQGQRAELYKQAQVVFNEEVPAILFGSSSALLAVSKSVEGFTPAVFGTSRFSGVTVP
ncbi:ABC transporter substrate-binding protein [Microvirga pudoricolor]|uniref:ABC transporter substrate-binding protein n=1 Tax=Microvirga pudoricolor TaxID=2778729 RepID=UPI00195117CA|nr:ABC transporter substrate-binding protein [Microvirga pudoricolor]MBM6595138.1 ABC transporter substrate-binding protein [Microvirga pudoricolor]